MGTHMNKAVIITALVLGGNLLFFQITRWLFNSYRIDALGFEIGYAVTALLPAIVAWTWLALSGERGPGWPLLCLPGILLWAARPYRGSEGWTSGWVFDDLVAYGGIIVMDFDRAPLHAFAAINATVLLFLVPAGAVAMAVQGSRLGGAGQVRRFGGRAGGGHRNTEREDLQRARWASRKEVREQFSHPGGIVIGEMTDPLRETPDFGSKRAPWRSRRQGRGRLITMDPAEGNGHVLAIAPSGGYKTSGLVIPNILHYDGPLVVFDPKGDLYARTRDARREMGYDAVVIDAENGFDPFKMIAPLAGQAPSVYYTMAKNLMPLSARAHDVSEYFHDMSVSLFAALTAHFVRQRSPNIALDIARFLSRPREVVIAEGASIAAEHNLPFINDEMSGLASLDARTFPGVVKGIKNKLAFIEFPDVARHATSTRSPQEHLNALGPRTDIFININSLMAKDFASFPRTLIGGMFVVAELLEQPDRPRARRLFLIDEARVLGGMDILTNVRDAGRSLGLHLMLIYQSLGQVQEAWGGKAGAEAWIDSCEARIVSAVGASGTASDISTMLGLTTLSVSTTGRSSRSPVFSLMGDSVSASKNEQLRDVPLLNQAELGQIPAHGSVIFTRRTKPILATKAVWFTRPDMKHRVRDPDEVAHELPVNQRREAILEALQRYRPAPTDDDGWVGSESPSEEAMPFRKVRREDAAPPRPTGGTSSPAEPQPDEDYPVPEDAGQPDLFALGSSSADHAAAAGPKNDTDNGKVPDSAKAAPIELFRSCRNKVVPTPPDPPFLPDGDDQPAANAEEAVTSQHGISSVGKEQHMPISEGPGPDRSEEDVSAAEAPSTGPEDPSIEEPDNQTAVNTTARAADGEVEPAATTPPGSGIVPHHGPPRIGLPPGFPSEGFTHSAFDDSSEAQPIEKPIASEKDSTEPQLDDTEPQTAESDDQLETDQVTRPPRSLSAAASDDPLTARSMATPAQEPDESSSDVGFWGHLGTPVSALDFGHRRCPHRFKYRALNVIVRGLGPVRDRWLGPPGDLPINLDPATFQRIPHPRDAQDSPWILRAWDRLDWYLSHPADRYFVYGHKRRTREAHPPLIPTRDGLKLWSEPQPVPPSHDELRRRISPDTTDVLGTGDAYNPDRNSVSISWSLDPAVAAEWSVSEIGPIPIGQPRHLIFEQVRSAAMKEQEFADGDEAHHRWRKRYHSFLAQQALVQNLLTSGQPIEGSSLVSAFLEAWPQIPRDHVSALRGSCSAAQLPLRHWTACLWAEELDGGLRLCRQVLGAGGVPLGAARTWPIEGKARQWLT